MTLDVLPVKVVTMIEIFEALLRHDRAQRLEARCTAWPSISNKIADAGGPEISQAACAYAVAMLAREYVR